MTGLVDTARILEERMQSSSLYPLFTFDRTHTLTAATSMFGRKSDVELVMGLETAYHSRHVKLQELLSGFSQVSYLIVNAHYIPYDLHNFRVSRPSFSKTATVLMPNIEDGLADITIELCFGTSGLEVPINGRLGRAKERLSRARSSMSKQNNYNGDVILTAELSEEGTVSELWHTAHPKGELAIKKGDDVLTAFRLLEDYVKAYTPQ